MKEEEPKEAGIKLGPCTDYRKPLPPDKLQEVRQLAIDYLRKRGREDLISFISEGKPHWPEYWREYQAMKLARRTLPGEFKELLARFEALTPRT